jgi:threonine aldolase
VHLDGARIFNAVAATQVAASRYAAVADTVQFCFSKGLGAPVGSVVCGPAETILEVRYLRRRLGGGMRQAGVIAAAARVALAERDRLIEDHVLARMIGEALAERFPGSVDTDSIETNMIRVDVERIGMDWVEIRGRLEAAGLKANPPQAGSWRIVTHRDVNGSDADRLLAALS